jgi:hypothetical protein
MAVFVYGVIFITMSKKRPIKENQFDMGIAGTSGAISYGPGWGTFASPNVSQDTSKFSKIGDKALGSNSNTATGTPASKDALDADVEGIYSKTDTPSPDEVLTGLKYELQNMIKKDKARAKEIVIHNLKQDPHYYGELKMWNIDDKEMMNVEPIQKTGDDPLKERIAVLDEMIAKKFKRAEMSQELKDALKDTKQKRDERYQKS